MYRSEVIIRLREHLVQPQAVQGCVAAGTYRDRTFFKVAGTGSGTMKVVIDRGSCVSCGTCWETCPDLFEQDPDDSFSRIREPYRSDGDIATGIPHASLDTCAQEAANLCPVQVIGITPS